MERIKRREFFRKGITLALVSLFTKVPFRLFSSAEPEPWIEPKEARVSFISGDFFINGIRAEVGASIVEGDTIQTGDQSEADIEIKDYAIFHMKENTVIEMNDIAAAHRVTVKKGWFLSIVRRGNTFQVKTPTLLAGVRGTVLFVNVLSDDKVYLCDCNGKVDLIDTRTMSKLKSIVSEYHTAFSIERAGTGVQITRADLLYHHDGDILKIDERFLQETRVFRMRRGGRNY